MQREFFENIIPLKNSPLPIPQWQKFKGMKFKNKINKAKPQYYYVSNLAF